MDLVFYADPGNRIQKQALAHVQRGVPDADILVCRTVDELSRKIQRSSIDLLAVVLLVENNHELTSILFLQEELQRHRVILVLPDLLRETTTRGHVLRPRFLTSTDSDLHELSAVLSKMRRNAIGNRERSGEVERERR
jgi:DNA invertase Pin-like site-specific DNA recombinase